ncbi:MAG: hypothetical protein ACP5N2_05005 [Candidatus Nanoarchaeia archaeon]
MTTAEIKSEAHGSHEYVRTQKVLQKFYTRKQRRGNRSARIPELKIDEQIEDNSLGAVMSFKRKNMFSLLLELAQKQNLDVQKIMNYEIYRSPGNVSYVSLALAKELNLPLNRVGIGGKLALNVYENANKSEGEFISLKLFYSMLSDYKKKDDIKMLKGVVYRVKVAKEQFQNKSKVDELNLTGAYYLTEKVLLSVVYFKDFLQGDLFSLDEIIMINGWEQKGLVNLIVSKKLPRDFLVYRSEYLAVNPKYLDERGNLKEVAPLVLRELNSNNLREEVSNGFKSNSSNSFKSMFYEKDSFLKKMEVYFNGKVNTRL